jgi:hypothetical protein
MAIIEARGLARTFKSRKRTVEALRGVGLAVVCLWLGSRVFVQENA